MPLKKRAEQQPIPLSHEQNALLVIDFIHRLMMHHAIWYAEVKKLLGVEKTQEILGSVYKRSYDIQMQKIASVLGFDMKENIPAPILNLSAEKLEKLKETIAINWLANDGVWFQAVEFSRGMDSAKKCNDSCWGQFSPFEAWSIKQFLKLPEKSGLEGLRKALPFRLYATINKQSIGDENKDGFIFEMNDCRVQSARKRKGLDDYPCKSAGIVEYSTFAESIDPRIRTRCVACPPDKHPDEWYCSWHFWIEK